MSMVFAFVISGFSFLLYSLMKASASFLFSLCYKFTGTITLGLIIFLFIPLVLATLLSVFVGLSEDFSVCLLLKIFGWLTISFDIAIGLSTIKGKV